MADAKFTAGFHRFRLQDGQVRHNKAEHPILGASAEVSTSGFFVTRRNYLTVSGPGWSHVAAIDSITMTRARRFAAAVNAAAQAASLAA